MNFSLDGMISTLLGTQSFSVEFMVFGLLVAFIIGQLNAWFYKWTHRGVSYSRTFTQALVLITMISMMSMMLIMTAPLAAFGLLGGMAIIRFRTVVRDARDNVYVLLCLVCGMAAGMGLVMPAVAGAIGANLIAWYLHQTGFGGWRSLDSVLRMQVEASGFDETAVSRLIRGFCRKQVLVSMDEGPSHGSEGGRAIQCVYKIRLRNPENAPALINALRACGPVRFVNLLVDPEREEVT